MITLAVHFTIIVETLAWLAIALLNFWIWQKSKATGNMLMMIGAGVKGVLYLVFWFASPTSEFMYIWVPFLGFLTFVVGFVMSIKPLVAAQLDAIANKMKELAAEKEDAPAASDGESSS